METEFLKYDPNVTIESLPFEILSHLLSFVTERQYWAKASQTCRLWREAAIFSYDFTKDQNCALKRVISNKDIVGLRLLLSCRNIDPSFNNNICIKYAARNGFLEIVKLLLLDERVDPSCSDNFCIIWASQVKYGIPANPARMAIWKW